MFAALLASALVATGAPDSLASLPKPRAGTLRVFLVRHGQALSNLDPAPDLPKDALDHLTTLGREQATQAGQALRGQGVSRVLTSPARRARETAELVAGVLGAPEATPEARLRPLELGNAGDGRPLDWDARIADWEKGNDPAPPGGESMEQLGRRVAELVATLTREASASVIVLVAHSEVIGAYVGLLRGTLPARRYPPAIANGSITVVDARPGAAASLLVVDYRALRP